MKLETINRKKNIGEFHKQVESKLFLNNQWVKEEITGGIRRDFEMNEKNTMYQKLRYAAKVMLIGNVIAF